MRSRRVGSGTGRRGSAEADLLHDAVRTGPMGSSRCLRGPGSTIVCAGPHPEIRPATRHERATCVTLGVSLPEPVSLPYRA